MAALGGEEIERAARMWPGTLGKTTSSGVICRMGGHEALQTVPDPQHELQEADTQVGLILDSVQLSP